jgi:hypothetical protein
VRYIEASRRVDTIMVFESHAMDIILLTRESNLTIPIVHIGICSEDGLSRPDNWRRTQALQLSLVEVNVEKFEVFEVETLM